MAETIELPELIVGGRVALRPLEDGDLAAYARAFAEDPALGPAYGSETDPDEASLRGLPQRAAEGAAAGGFVELAIADPADDRLLGTVILHSFDWRHQHTEVGFWLLSGERGAGVATEAVGLTVEWAFAELGMHRVEMVTVPSLPHIERVLALAERLGFQREGVMRERNFERGERLDTVMLAVLRAEWKWPPAQVSVQP